MGFGKVFIPINSIYYIHREDGAVVRMSFACYAGLLLPVIIAGGIGLLSGYSPILAAFNTGTGSIIVVPPYFTVLDKAYTLKTEIPFVASIYVSDNPLPRDLNILISPPVASIPDVPAFLILYLAYLMTALTAIYYFSTSYEGYLYGRPARYCTLALAVYLGLPLAMGVIMGVAWGYGAGLTAALSPTPHMAGLFLAIIVVFTALKFCDLC